MSMRNYACVEYGIVLNGLMDHELLEELAEDETVESVFSFTGEAFPLKDDGSLDWANGDYFDDESVYYLSSRCPALFEAVFPDMKAMVSDMLSRYREAWEVDGRLPRLTSEQVRKHLRAIQGTYFG